MDRHGHHIWCTLQKMQFHYHITVVLIKSQIARDTFTWFTCTLYCRQYFAWYIVMEWISHCNKRFKDNWSTKLVEYVRKGATEIGHVLFEYYASICLKHLGKIVTNVSHNSWPPGLNSGPFQYEARLLTIPSQLHISFKNLKSSVVKYVSWVLFSQLKHQNDKRICQSHSHKTVC